MKGNIKSGIKRGKFDKRSDDGRAGSTAHLRRSGVVSEADPKLGRVTVTVTVFLGSRTVARFSIDLHAGSEQKENRDCG